MLRVGLTGGIGCGKSTVAAMMRELGCHVMDADKIAHKVIEPGQPPYDEVIHEFGREIIASDGRVDRPKLGKIVFGNPARLARLNAIVHPAVLAELEREFDRLLLADPEGVAVADVALLIESGYHRQLDRLVVAWCTPDQQRRRLTDASSGRGMSSEEAERRIGAQMNLAEKRKIADDQIDCSGTIEETRMQVEALVARYKSIAAGARG